MFLLIVDKFFKSQQVYYIKHFTSDFHPIYALIDGTRYYTQPINPLGLGSDYRSIQYFIQVFWSQQRDHLIIHSHLRMRPYSSPNHLGHYPRSLVYS